MRHWVYTLPLRLRSLFRRRRAEQDLAEEFQFHLDQLIEANLSQLIEWKNRQAGIVTAISSAIGLLGLVGHFVWDALRAKH